MYGYIHKLIKHKTIIIIKTWIKMNIPHHMVIDTGIGCLASTLQTKITIPHHFDWLSPSWLFVTILADYHHPDWLELRGQSCE